MQYKVYPVALIELEVSQKKLRVQPEVSDHSPLAVLLGTDVPELTKLLDMMKLVEEGISSRLEHKVDRVGRMLKHVMRLIVWKRRWRV